MSNYIVPMGGKHYIIDIWTDNIEILKSISHMKEMCIDAALNAKATIIKHNFHDFGENYGVTGVIILSESHITIHTWPEDGYAAIDVFMCGSCDPEDTINIFENKLKNILKKNITKIKRGENVKYDAN